ncbi:MAG: hypothetical protein WKG07_40800 [Hymenobacter sp.]
MKKLSPQAEKNYTSEEYLRIERASSTETRIRRRQNFIASAGSNRTRSLIGSNTTIAVGNRIHGQKNEIYAGNMRVQISPNRFSYPDVVIVSGKPAFRDDQFRRFAESDDCRRNLIRKTRTRSTKPKSSKAIWRWTASANTC